MCFIIYLTLTLTLIKSTLWAIILIITLKTTRWGIREFAESFNVTPRTIRFYEDKGLLKPSRNSGARIFDHEDYVRFERIMRAKRIGFRLDDIKEVLDVTDGEITGRSELLKRKKQF
jgi:DNA-binding transcriptional MerR regulator